MDHRGEEQRVVALEIRAHKSANTQLSTGERYYTLEPTGNSAHLHLSCATSINPHKLELQSLSEAALCPAVCDDNVPSAMASYSAIQAHS